MSELSPKEFIYGKLYGVLYNSKEMIALPVLTAIGMFVLGIFSGENLVLFLIDFLLLVPFRGNARTARRDHVHQQPHCGGQQPGDDLLPHGRHLALCVLDRAQQPGIRPPTPELHDLHRGRQRRALWLAWGQESVATRSHLSRLLTPFWTFYCIISLVNGDVMAAFLVSAGVYGFAILAMLVPAVGDFDIALGRTSAIQG